MIYTSLKKWKNETNKLSFLKIYNCKEYIILIFKNVTWETFAIIFINTNLQCTLNPKPILKNWNVL
jgi:hypothetical protein